MTDSGSLAVSVELLRLDPDLPLPRYARDGDAGADLPIRVDCVLGPGVRRVVPTGIAIGLPLGWAGFVHPRSGLAARTGLTIVNAPGTIDSGYRGEIMVCLLNTDAETPIRLARGDLIAQLVVQQVAVVDFVEVSSLSETDRGDGGYGSTGGIAEWAAPAATMEGNQ